MSTRTVIVLSALSETTMPWRDLRRARRRARAAASDRRSASRRACPCALARPARRACGLVGALGLALGLALLRRARRARPARAALAARARRRRSLGASTSCGSAAGGRRLGLRRSGRRLALGGRRPVLGGRLGASLRASSGVSIFVSHCPAPPGCTSMSRSRATVSARASSRLARRRPAVLSSSPVACWKRRPNRSRRAVPMCSARSRVGACRAGPSRVIRRPLASRTWS